MWDLQVALESVVATQAAFRAAAELSVRAYDLGYEEGWRAAQPSRTKPDGDRAATAATLDGGSAEPSTSDATAQREAADLFVDTGTFFCRRLVERAAERAGRALAVRAALEQVCDEQFGVTAQELWAGRGWPVEELDEVVSAWPEVTPSTKAVAEYAEQLGQAWNVVAAAYRLLPDRA